MKSEIVYTYKGANFIYCLLLIDMADSVALNLWHSLPFPSPQAGPPSLSPGQENYRQ